MSLQTPLLAEISISSLLSLGLLIAWKLQSTPAPQPVLVPIPVHPRRRA